MRPFFMQNKKCYFCVNCNRMKRILPILIGVFYLFASIGIAATVHFCGGKVADVSFTVSENKSCCCGPVEATKSCCQNWVIAFEIPTDDYLPSKRGVQLNDLTVLNSVVQTTFYATFAQVSNGAIAVNWLAYLPPGKAIRIAQQSLLFYS